MVGVTHVVGWFLLSQQINSLKKKKKEHAYIYVVFFFMLPWHYGTLRLFFICAKKVVYDKEA